MTQGRGVTVAVLDTGVEAGIPDLSGVVLPGTDADGGGGDGRTDLDEARVPGHGTGMASLIASQGTGTGFAGVAPQAKILPVRVNIQNTSAAAAIRYAVDHKAKVVNISQAAPGGCPIALQEAVAYALSRDVVVVAGAGNDGSTTNSSMFPANCAGVLAVGAVDSRFNPWVDTQKQSYVAVAGPGVDVDLIAKDGQVHSTDGGSSSASALVSAVVALVRSKFPDMSARQVVQQIITSAGDVGPKGRDDQTGYGLIRPTRILNGTVPKNGPNPVFDAYDQWKAENSKQSGAAPRSNAEDSSMSPLLIGGVGAVAVALVILLVVVQVRNRRRLQVARAGQHGAGPGGPPAFGGPYPPQGGQPPAHYPPAGPQGAPPPPQGPYPNPGQPGPWNTPDQRP